ncbi:MAG: metalloregulator ArsR/SmtB family transcription factor [Bacillota bacterium]
MELSESEKLVLKASLTEKAEFLKALAHPVRLCILRMLLDGSSNVTQMNCCIGASQSNLSQHLAKLRSAGIVKGTREGAEIYYSIKDGEMQHAIACILNGQNTDNTEE